MFEGASKQTPDLNILPTRLECCDLRLHLFRRNLCAAVGLLRIQSIIFYVVLNITTCVELQFTRSQIIRTSTLPCYYMDCLILMSEQIVMFLKWSMRLSQEVKDLQVTYLIYLLESCPTRFFAIKLQVLPNTNTYVCTYYFLCICHPLLAIWWFTCELINLSRSLEIVGSYLVNYLLCLFFSSYIYEALHVNGCVSIVRQLDSPTFLHKTEKTKN